MSHHQVVIAGSLITSYLSKNILIFVLCHEEVLVVCKRILQQISSVLFIYVVIFIYCFLMFYKAVIALENIIHD